MSIAPRLLVGLGGVTFTGPSAPGPALRDPRKGAPVARDVLALRHPGDLAVLADGLHGPIKHARLAGGGDLPTFCVYRRTK